MLAGDRPELLLRSFRWSPDAGIHQRCLSTTALLRLRLSVTNVLNALYVSDANNNSQYANNKYGPEGGSGWAEVFIGPPRMVRLSAVLELKGLQNMNPTK